MADNGTGMADAIMKELNKPEGGEKKEEPKHVSDPLQTALERAFAAASGGKQDAFIRAMKAAIRIGKVGGNSD